MHMSILGAMGTEILTFNIHKIQHLNPQMMDIYFWIHSSMLEQRQNHYPLCYYFKAPYQGEMSYGQNSQLAMKKGL